MDISEVKPGDTTWILNGVRNRAFRATVIANVDLIVVRNEDERNKTFGQLLEFEKETGLAYSPDDSPWKGDPPLLVPDGHPRVVEIERRRKHREFREIINNAANNYNERPTQENYAYLVEVVEGWNKNSTGRNFKEHTIESAIREQQQ